MTRRALGGFIIINVVVSLAVAFLALQLWSSLSDDSSNEPTVPQARPVVITATSRPGELPASAFQGTIDALQQQLDRNGSGGTISTPIAQAPTDNAPLPTINSSALPQGVPPLNPTILANITLPAISENNGSTGNTTTVDGCERYIVVQGDTCIAIANKFDVALNDLIGLNGLDANCTNLRVDQVLVLPSASCSLPPTPTQTATVTNTPFPIGTFSITNTPVPTAIDADVQILQVLNFGDVTIEQVDIENTGDAVVNVRDWKLRDEDGNTFTFPDLLLQPGQRIRVFSRSGQNTPAALYWNQTTPIWTLGENVLLSDNDEIVQSSFTVGGETIEFN